jgi:hypothetical protein
LNASGTVIFCPAGKLDGHGKVLLQWPVSKTQTKKSELFVPWTTGWARRLNGAVPVLVMVKDSKILLLLPKATSPKLTGLGSA